MGKKKKIHFWAVTNFKGSRTVYQRICIRETSLEIVYSPAELLMCRRLRTTLPMVQELRVPKLPDLTVLSKKKDQVKGRQKKNFDADHGVKMLSTLYPGDTVWIVALWGGL